MFVSALQPYAIAAIISVIAVQYIFALFCFFRLAYLDIPRKKYVLWNIFILIVFFIGGAVFLVYYGKHPELRIDKTASAAPPTEADVGDEPDGREKDPEGSGNAEE